MGAEEKKVRNPKTEAQQAALCLEFSLTESLGNPPPPLYIPYYLEEMIRNERQVLLKEILGGVIKDLWLKKDPEGYILKICEEKEEGLRVLPKELEALARETGVAPTPPPPGYFPPSSKTWQISSSRKGVWLFYPKEEETFALNLREIWGKNPEAFRQIIEPYIRAGLTISVFQLALRELEYHRTPREEVLPPFMCAIAEAEDPPAEVKRLLAALTRNPQIDPRRLTRYLTRYYLPDYLKHLASCPAGSAEERRTSAALVRLYERISSGLDTWREWQNREALPSALEPEVAQKKRLEETLEEIEAIISFLETIRPTQETPSELDLKTILGEKLKACPPLAEMLTEVEKIVNGGLERLILESATTIRLLASVRKEFEPHLIIKKDLEWYWKWGYKEGIKRIKTNPKNKVIEYIDPLLEAVLTSIAIRVAVNGCSERGAYNNLQKLFGKLGEKLNSEKAKIREEIERIKEYIEIARLFMEFTGATEEEIRSGLPPPNPEVFKLFCDFFGIN